LVQRSDTIRNIERDEGGVRWEEWLPAGIQDPMSKGLREDGM
jgi:hypothetical protein